MAPAPLKRLPFVCWNPAGSPDLDQAKRLKELEAENARLKKLVVKAEPISGCDALNSAIRFQGTDNEIIAAQARS